MTRKLLLKGGRLVDPASRHDGTADVLVEGGRVVEVGPGLDGGRAEVVDCAGLVVCPGLVDLHVHLREPGHEHKETIASGSRPGRATCTTCGRTTPGSEPTTVAKNSGSGSGCDHATSAATSSMAQSTPPNRVMCGPTSFMSSSQRML